MATGRPSKYKQGLCPVVVKLALQDKSMTEIAKAIGITRETLYQWKKAYPEFSDSLQGITKPKQPIVMPAHMQQRPLSDWEKAVRPQPGLKGLI